MKSDQKLQKQDFLLINGFRLKDDEMKSFQQENGFKSCLIDSLINQSVDQRIGVKYFRPGGWGVGATPIR